MKAETKSVSKRRKSKVELQKVLKVLKYSIRKNSSYNKYFDICTFLVLSQQMVWQTCRYYDICRYFLGGNLTFLCFLCLNNVLLCSSWIFIKSFFWTDQLKEAVNFVPKKFIGWFFCCKIHKWLLLVVQPIIVSFSFHLI